MQARRLQKLLDTTRTVHLVDNKICVASALCHDLLNIDMDSGIISYKLNTFNQALDVALAHSGDLLNIYHRLHVLWKDGTLNEIMKSDDVIEDPIPVYQFVDGNLVTKFIDELGWPNVTSDGELMYDNVWFPSVDEALHQAKREAQASISFTERLLDDTRSEVTKLETELLGFTNELELLNAYSE